jgi:hypothetical protein
MPEEKAAEKNADSNSTSFVDVMCRAVENMNAQRREPLCVAISIDGQVTLHRITNSYKSGGNEIRGLRIGFFRVGDSKVLVSVPGHDIYIEFETGQDITFFIPDKTSEQLREYRIKLLGKACNVGWWATEALPKADLLPDPPLFKD